jgi:hypothetical protein
MATINGNLRLKKARNGTALVSGTIAAPTNTLLIGEPGFTYIAADDTASTNAVSGKLYIGKKNTSGANVVPEGVMMDWQAVASGSTVIGTVKYNGTTAASGNFYGGTATLPSNTTRLNYDGNFYVNGLFTQGTLAVGSGTQRWQIDSSTTTLRFLSGVDAGTLVASISSAGLLTLESGITLNNPSSQTITFVKAGGNNATLTAAASSGTGAAAFTLPQKAGGSSYTLLTTADIPSNLGTTNISTSSALLSSSYSSGVITFTPYTTAQTTGGRLTTNITFSNQSNTLYYLGNFYANKFISYSGIDLSGDVLIDYVNGTRSISVGASGTAGTAGSNLNIQAGNTKEPTVAANLSAGNLVLRTGQSVGTAGAEIQFFTTNRAGSTSTTLNALAERARITNSGLEVVSTTSSTATNNGALTVAGGVGIAGSVNIGGSLTLGGNLTVNGTLTTLNSNTITINDKTLVLGEIENVQVFGVTIGVNPGVVTISIPDASAATLITGMTVTGSSGSNFIPLDTYISAIGSSSGGNTSITIKNDTPTAIPNATNYTLTFSGSENDLTADEGGLVVRGTTDKTILWKNDGTGWNISDNIALPNEKSLILRSSTAASTINTLDTATRTYSLSADVTGSNGIIMTTLNTYDFGSWTS